jgi:uncharacterized protein YaiE (UPF0345 family)
MKADGKTEIPEHYRNLEEIVDTGNFSFSAQRNKSMTINYNFLDISVQNEGQTFFNLSSKFNLSSSSEFNLQFIAEMNGVIEHGKNLSFFYNSNLTFDFTNSDGRPFNFDRKLEFGFSIADKVSFSTFITGSDTNRSIGFAVSLFSNSFNYSFDN